MKTRYPHRLSRGTAALEFMLFLPLLMLLALPIIDLARVLQANMILTGMSREGANLASRTHETEQSIMNSLAATALPLFMRDNGMIRITKVMAVTSQGVTRNVVVSQHRWAGGSYNPDKGVWTCGAAGSRWDGTGRCIGLPPAASAPVVDVMTGQLVDGDVIHVVEVFYRFPLLFSGLDLGIGLSFPELDPELYAVTIL